MNIDRPWGIIITREINWITPRGKTKPSQIWPGFLSTSWKIFLLPSSSGYVSNNCFLLWISTKINGLPNAGMFRNLVGKIFPYAAVIHSSGSKAFKVLKNMSWRKIRRNKHYNFYKTYYLLWLCFNYWNCIAFTFSPLWSFVSFEH